MNTHLTHRLIVATAAVITITACGADEASPNTTIVTVDAEQASEVQQLPPVAVDPEVRRFEQLAPPAVDPEIRRFEQLAPAAVDPEIRRFEQLAPPAVDPEIRRFERLVPPAVDPEIRRFERLVPAGTPRQRFSDDLAPRLEPGALGPPATIVQPMRPASGWF